MDPFFEKFIADLVKGASASPFTGTRPSVEVNTVGGTYKLAALDEVTAVMTKLGFFTMHDPAAVAQQLVHGSGPLGPTAGALLPSPMPGAGAAKPPPLPAAAMRKGPPPIPAAAMKRAHDEGAHAALAAFGVKEAFLPMLGAIAGPMLARAGIGRLAAGAGGKMLGGIAGKVAPRIAGGMGGAAFDMAASSAGQNLGQRMQQPQQPAM